MSRYTNIDGSKNVHGIGSVLKWKLGLHDGPKNRSAGRVDTPLVANDGLALKRPGEADLTWIGHATYLVQLGGRAMLIDPVFSTRIAVVRRIVPPGVAGADLPKIDVVLVTHNHRDHMDAPSLRALGPDVVYVVPEGLGPWFQRAGLRRVVEMRWWEEREVEGVQVTFVPAQHWSRRGLRDENKTLWGGYVLQRGGARVYHSGDTAWFSGFAEIATRVGAIDAAMLPIGAYEPRWFMKTQHINPAEAVRAFVALGAQRFVAMHWGTFKLTDEPLDEPPQLLRSAWEQTGLPDARCCVPAVGQTLRL
ncbi:MAG: MBL fold metallo-hydrolase [Nannocystaceae bacterium]|nr:MBL fold metallo-hydrolase [Nannocystaceae bacterium]